jgi:diguanylate cyclase (GGDEF)-like protein/PAS domain S-box-containing protein
MGPEPHPLVRRYCSHSDLHYQVSKRVREMLVFSAQDLTRDPPFPRLDLISCRNVLIYFRPQVQSRILHTLAFALRPGGLLFLGRSEATHVEPGLFATIDEKAHLYRRSESAQVTLPGPATTPRLTPAMDRGLGRDRPNGPSLGERIFAAMQGAWISAGVVVDEQLEIQHVLGDVSPFLRVPQGKPELNIAALVIDPLRMELRSALFRAQRGEGRSVVQVVRAPSLPAPVGLAVLPIPPKAGLPALFLVRFDQLVAEPDGPASAEADPRDGSIRGLEDQLAATREHLQTVIEELETANEELQSLNEELSSANEELQSTNEEMETANEELQSANEELTTVNEKLEAKTHELTVLNNDLRNVKDSLDFPLVVVDEFQRVSLFNPAARSVFELDDASLGQLLLSIPCRVDAAPLGAALRAIAETGSPSMFQIDGERSYAVHVRPYLDDRHQRRGAVITFIDNTDIRRAGRDLRESNQRLDAAQRFSTATLDALPEHICVLDERGEIVAVNAAWTAFARQNADGGRDSGLGGNYLRVCERAAAGGDREAGIFLEGLRAVMQGTAPFFAFEYPCHSPTEQRWVEAHVAPFAGSGPRFVVVSHENVTARRLTEERLMLQGRTLDSSINGILIADARAPDFPLLYVNRAFEELTGYEAAEVLGRNCRFLHADDAEQPGLRTVRECLHDFRPGRALLRNYRKDGTLFWNELSLYPVPGADGAPAYMVGIQIDKTALIASEEALSQSLEREKRTLAFAGVGTFDWEIRSGRITLSEANRALFGLSLAGELDYPALRGRVQEDDRPVFDDAVRVCVAGHGNLDVEFRVNWPDATVHWLHVKGSVEADPAGMPQRLLCLCQDITQRREADERVRFVAQHDVLTGLPNRALLRDRLQHALGNARRRHERVAVLFIDLDRFKEINDSLGHEVGDRLLQSVANRLRGCVRETDTVCRQGGGEYIVVLPGIRDSNEAAHVATKVLEALSLAHRIGQHELSVTPSIGVSVYPDDGGDIDVLVRNADSAMYHAKGAGRANFQFFTPEMNEWALHKVAMVNELRQAIAHDGLVLHYQPQFRVGDRGLVGFEALVRWHHPARGLLLPGEFIPVAEESDLIRDLGAWVVREVCRQQRRWLDQGLTCVPVAMNVSPLQLRTREIIEEISGALHESGVEGSLLELEVTESGVMRDPELAAEMIAALQRLDIRVAIDDFGIGHSSLAQLRHFNIQKLKIARSFVTDLPGDDDAAAIARAIITLARSLKLDVVAEGVEDTGQLDFLLGEGCGTYQGFLASHPLPARQAEALLAA